MIVRASEAAPEEGVAMRRSLHDCCAGERARVLALALALAPFIRTHEGSNLPGVGSALALVGESGSSSSAQWVFSHWSSSYSYCRLQLRRMST